MSLHIAPGKVDSLFPAHLRLDSELRITRIGPSLARMVPSLRRGLSLLGAFTTTQVATADDLRRIAETCGTIRLRPCEQRFTLAGTVLSEPAGFFLALQFQPSLVNDDHADLRLEDFSPGDPFVLGMMLIRLQKGLLDEAHQSARDLDRERQRSMELIERISRISSYAAHDFNNLLSVVALNANLLRKHGSLTERQFRCLEIIEETIARGSDVTRSLLALARQRDSSRAVYPVDRLIGDDAAFLQTMAGSKIVLELNLAAPDGWIDVSRVGLSQCLVNLVVNAREAMPDGGRLNITSRILPRPDEVAPGPSTPDRWVTIAVSDTGHGMGPEDARQAFELFFSTKQRGSGLGLASARDFVQEHGGLVSLDTTLGQGLTVLLQLPMAPAPGTALPKDIGGQRRQAFPRVLVVDDEPFALDALAELLEQDGYSIAVAACAQEALKILREAPCGVLLCDLEMPDMSGIELATQAAADNPALQVVLMSGSIPNPDDIREGWRFLPKPIDSVQLRRLLSAAIEQAAG